MKKTIAVVMLAASVTFGLAATAEAKGGPDGNGSKLERAEGICTDADGEFLPILDAETDAVIGWNCVFEPPQAKVPKLKGACKGLGGNFLVFEGADLTRFVCSSI